LLTRNRTLRSCCERRIVSETRLSFSVVCFCVACQAVACLAARTQMAVLAFSCLACDEGLGLPLALHLRLYRRWLIESPRCSHHSAVPTYRSSSFLKSQPFGIADDSLSELPRTLNPPAPIDGYPSYLGSRTIRFALVQSPSCPGHLPSAAAIDQFPGCPKSWVSHRSPIPRASSFPESWILG